MLNVVHHALKSVVKSSLRSRIFSWLASCAVRPIREVRLLTAFGAFGRGLAHVSASRACAERPTGPLDPSSDPVVTSSSIRVLRDPARRYERLVADDRRAFL